jgi:hypothetical protein
MGLDEHCRGEGVVIYEVPESAAGIDPPLQAYARR